MSKHHDTPAWLRAIQRDGGPVWHHEQGDSAPFQGRAVPLRDGRTGRVERFEDVFGYSPGPKAPRAAGDPAEPAETACEPPRTGGHLDAPERPYRVYRDGDRIAVTVSAEPLTLAEAMNLCAALLATTAPMHRATLPKERI